MRKIQTVAQQARAVLLLAAIFIGLVGCDKKPEAAATSTKSALAEFQGKIKVGHLVGICMSPLFVADAKGYFKDEGIDVKLEWMKNPSDATIALSGGAAQFIHNPFTN